MGQRSRILAQVLGVRGFKVVAARFETADGAVVVPAAGYDVRSDARLVLEVGRRWAPRCPRCMTLCRKVHERCPPRRWHDLPWAGRGVVLEYAPIRVWCPRCEETPVEALPFAEPYQRQTRRLQQHMALAAASAPVMHVAALYGVSWGTVHRAEVHALERWDRERAAQPDREPLRRVGIDEKYLGRRNAREDKFVTLISDLDTGEPLFMSPGRRRESVEVWLATITTETKKTIELFAMDMHDPFALAVRGDRELGHAKVIHDPFHLVKRAGEAVDAVRREVFFRAGKEQRGVGRGARWLFLRASQKLRSDERLRLGRLLAMNRRLAHAYQVKEQLRYVVSKSVGRSSIEVGLDRLMRRTQRRDNVPMRKLHDSLRAHREAILDLGEHRPPTGRIEALNNNWETTIRRGRGYRNLDHLMLKLRFATVNPIRTDDGTRRFLALGLHAPRETRVAGTR